MKRIDLHIHTVCSPLDTEFEFSLDALRKHVERNGLDAIAITNHNLFDPENYKSVCAAFGDSVLVFPGIEVSVRHFHVVVVANPAHLDTFIQACDAIPEIGQEEDGLPIEGFLRLFGDGSYVVIPHFKKKPQATADDLNLLGDAVTALEVSSEKKWHYEHDRNAKPVVLFSDFRCCDSIGLSSGRYTYVDVSTKTFNSLRLALDDRSKVAITLRDEHFELSPGLYASMGLNVVIGERSSGKTYLLDSIYQSCDPDDVVYIRQFGIVKDAEEKAFKQMLADEDKSIKSAYYEPMVSISSAFAELPSKEKVTTDIKNNLDELHLYADTSALDDEFSKCPLFSEGKLSLESVSVEQKVCEAVIVLLQNNPLTREIDDLVGRENLVALLDIAISRYKEKKLRRECADRANKIAEKIRGELTSESRRPGCPASPFLTAARRFAYVARLAKLRDVTKGTTVVDTKNVGKFKRVTKRIPYKDATALKKALKTDSSLGGSAQLGDEEFVERILCIPGLADISHAFFDIEVSLLNERDESVSGGQKAEYLFFKALDKAASHDIVLIDEPESSFDNPFLNELIAWELKKVSEKATVFIATHNNVLGVSIKPSSLLYTVVEDDKHVVYSCDVTDEMMTSAEGARASKSEILLKLMEAGDAAYEDRRPYYGLA